MTGPRFVRYSRPRTTFAEDSVQVDDRADAIFVQDYLHRTNTFCSRTYAFLVNYFFLLVTGSTE